MSWQVSRRAGLACAAGGSWRHNRARFPGLRGVNGGPMWTLRDHRGAAVLQGLVRCWSKVVSASASILAFAGRCHPAGAATPGALRAPTSDPGTDGKFVWDEPCGDAVHP